MKRLTTLLLMVMLLMSMTAYAQEVDVYASASATKTMLEGEALTAAGALLAQNDSDLATLAQTKEEGYTAPNVALGQIMSVNPDGSVGLSTISEWQYVQREAGQDQVIVELTHGQNALNLSEEGARGSLLVRLDGVAYLIHLDVVDSDEQVYTDEAYHAGEFDSHYSGAPNKLSSYTITSNVLCIETTKMLML